MNLLLWLSMGFSEIQLENINISLCACKSKIHHGRKKHGADYFPLEATKVGKPVFSFMYLISLVLYTLNTFHWKANCW